MDSQTIGSFWAVLARVRGASSYPEFLAELTRAATQIIGCDRASIYVYSHRRGAYLPAADHGAPAAVARDFATRGYTAETFPGAAELGAGKLIHAVRDGSQSAMQRILEQARLQALLAVDLREREASEGVLLLGLEHAPAFSAQQRDLVATLAPHIALLIRSGRREADRHKLVERRTQLANLSSDLLAAGDAQLMGERLCIAGTTIFRATRGDLLLEASGMLEMHASSAAAHPKVPRRMSLDDGPMLAELARESRVLVINDFMASRYGDAARARDLHAAALLAIPLADDEGRIGLLLVSEAEERYRFAPRDEEDARLLGTIATQAIRKGLLVEALRRASAAKSEFLANVSHDLRTPLNVILGYVDILSEDERGRLRAEEHEMLDRIRRTATGQLALIDDLLDLARIEQGKLAVRPRAVHVGELVAGLREMMEPLLRGRPVAFEVKVATDAVAQTDRERLRQVLVNLLANAAKFTRVGCVRLSACRVDDGIEIVVADTGPGIAPEIRSTALEPFVRGSGDGVGAGLGLAIVARLTKALDGILEIDGAPGCGTVVRVRLAAA